MPDEPALRPAIDHFDDGRVRYRGASLGGAMHGDLAFHRRDGSVLRAGAFDRGREVGRWRTRDRAGQVVAETDFGSGS